MQTINAIICLTLKCWESLKHLDSTETIIVSDLNLVGAVGKIVRPIIADVEESSLFSDLDKLFEKATYVSKSENLRGFINLFYECSIRPIAGYVDAIDMLLKRNKELNIIWWFGELSFCSGRYSAYFMAEYESQGFRLYNRNDVVAPYLYDFLLKSKSEIRVINRRLYSRQIINSYLRIFGVLFVKFYGGVLRWFRERYLVRRGNHQGARVDRIVIVRSQLQLDAINNYIVNTSKSILLCVGESFVDHGRCYASALSRYSYLSNVQIKKMLDPNFSNIVSEYFRSLFFILNSFELCLPYKGIVFDLSYAFKELLVMIPEVNSYERSLKTALNDDILISSALIFSTEQKTPHAFIDAKMAKFKILKIFHLMIVDQHVHKLPCPIFGDYFLCDSLKSKRQMSICHRDYFHRFFYFGTVRFLSKNLVYIEQVAENSEISRVCFFTQAPSGNPANYNYNFVAIRILSSICLSKGWSLFVKLHPRDFVGNYNNVISDGSLNVVFYDDSVNSEFALRDVDVAVSFLSAIVMESFYTNTPILILGFGCEGDPTLAPYWTDSYAGCVQQPSEIESVLSRNLFSLYSIYRKYIFEYLSIQFDIDYFDSSVDELAICDEIE